MIAFKFLAAGARGRFSGHAWPPPNALAPGAWVEVSPPLRACVQGIHACRASDLPFWLDEELWRIELEGELVVGKTMVIAQRGRLLSRVDAWADPVRAEFAEFCLARTHELVARCSGPELLRARALAADVARFVQRAEPASAAYVSAIAATCAGEQEAEVAYVAERSVQSAWLAERLA